MKEKRTIKSNSLEDVQKLLKEKEALKKKGSDPKKTLENTEKEELVLKEEEQRLLKELASSETVVTEQEKVSDELLTKKALAESVKSNKKTIQKATIKKTSKKDATADVSATEIEIQNPETVLDQEDPWEMLAKTVPYIAGEGINNETKLQEKVAWLEWALEELKNDKSNKAAYEEKLGVLKKIDEFLAKNPQLKITRNVVKVEELSNNENKENELTENLEEEVKTTVDSGRKTGDTVEFSGEDLNTMTVIEKGGDKEKETVTEIKESADEAQDLKLGEELINDAELKREIAVSPEIIKQVEETRENYIKEYKKCKKEADRQALIEKTRTATFNILAGVKNIFSKNKNEIKRSVNPEEFLSKEARETKRVYDEARRKMGEDMFEQKKSALEKAGLQGDELKKALENYKGTEILAKTIIEERQKIIDSKGKNLNPALWKKLVDGYMSLQPPWKKVAISTALFTAAASAGIVGGGIFAGYGLVGMVTMRFGTSMAMGMFIGHASKGIDLVRRNADLKFKETQEIKRSDLQQQFANNTIGVDEYEKGIESIDKIEKSRERNRVLAKAGLGVAIAAIGGFYAYDHLGNGIDNLTGAHHHVLDNMPHNVHTDTGTLNPQHPAHGAGVIKAPDSIKIVPHANVEAVADHGQGAISTLRELQNNLRAEYGNNLDNAPASVKHILNTDAHKLAQEYGMYKPGSDAESALIKSGSKFSVDQSGNVKFDNTILEKGTELKASVAYEGKMFDSDHSGINTTSPEEIPQYNPVGIDDNQIPQYSPEGLEDQTAPEGVNPTLDANTEIRTPESLNLQEAATNQESNTIETAVEMTRKMVRQMGRVFNHNIDHIFPNNYDSHMWENVKSWHADKLYNGSAEDMKLEYRPLYSYMHRLHEVTGLEPEGASLIKAAETNEEFINRALKKVTELGKLDQVKL